MCRSLKDGFDWHKEVKKAEGEKVNGIKDYF